MNTELCQDFHIYNYVQDYLGARYYKCEKCKVEVGMNLGDEIVPPSYIKDSEKEY